jgi:hypothetical protein
LPTPDGPVKEKYPERRVGIRQAGFRGADGVGEAACTAPFLADNARVKPRLRGKEASALRP